MHPPPPRTLLALVALGLLAGGVVAWRAGRRLAAEQHRQAGQAALERGELESAQRHLERYLALHPQDADVLFLAARTARRREAFGEAESYLDRCEGLVPRAELAVERAMFAVQQGQLGPWEDALAERVGGPNAYLRLEALARGRMKASRLSEALRDLNHLLRLQPNNVLGLMWRGSAYETLDEPEKAVKDYRQAVEIAPGWGHPRRLLAKLLARRGHPGEALVQYEIVRRLDGEDSEVMLALARCRQDLGEVENGQALLDRWLGDHPDDVPALVERARLDCGRKQWAEAEVRLRRAIELAPRDREALLARAHCLMGQGKPDESNRIMAQVREIEDDQFRVQRLIRRLAERPDDAVLHRDIGLTFLRLGQYPEAEQRLLRAVELDAAHRPAHEALAEYYARRGQADRAAHHRRLAGKTP